jgi:DNA-binding HxlR family transcriptional regulator
MEASGLIARTVRDTVTPPEVDYALTALGTRFVEPVEALYGWARDNADALDALTPRERSCRRA